MGHSRNGVIAYLLIAFGVAWGGIAFIFFVLDGSLMNPLLQIPVAFAPAIAALAVRKWVTKEGFGDAGGRLRLRPAKRYYLIAWIGPVAVLAAAIGLAAALAGYRPDFAAVPELVFGADLPWAAVLGIALAAPIAAMPVFWGEEFGWRGYLQQRVGRGPLSAALITGFIWAAWHYPLVFTDYAGGGDEALTIVTWTAQIMLQAIVLAWLFLRSGSVWVACLAHAGNNLVIGTFGHPLLVEQGGFAGWQVNLLESAPLAAVCAWILLTGRLTAAGMAQNTAATGIPAAARWLLTGMSTIGFIGSGNIGGAIARLAVKAGHRVVLSNSRGPETLADLVAELGPNAAAATPAEAAAAADIAVVSIPLHAYRSVPVEELRGKVVFDTNNYYPQRDGQIPELDDESTTVSELLQAHLPESFVIKAFNNIFQDHVVELARPSGHPERSLLAIAGDDAAAKRTATDLLDELGYDAYDVGPLAEGWRYQRDTPAYGLYFSAPFTWGEPAPAPRRLTPEILEPALKAAKRYRDM
nr:NAD(P)-binding domain-containing protein [Glycomyces albidus]